ncbi:hypothetical protein [Pseudaminobacter sp. NGMCC 1.201702]|uniref:hypothetical protein n=1 Tax=Pseudaminobacter sp. NGMCC 1.201702 TaxID=3391825 RepID=UPI0039F0F31B
MSGGNIKITVCVTVPDEDDYSPDEQAAGVIDGLSRMLCYDQVTLESVEYERKMQPDLNAANRRFG